MCGIAGASQSHPDRILEPESIVPVISLLPHWGRDDWGYHMGERRRLMLLHSLSNEDRSILTTLSSPPLLQTTAAWNRVILLTRWNAA